MAMLDLVAAVALGVFGFAAAPAVRAPQTAPVIRYATASTHLGAYDQSGRYGAPLLFDGDDHTAFCEGADGPGVGERVGLEFSRPIKADRIRIAAGEPMEFGRFMPANRPRAITLTNLRYTWQIILPDDAAPFELALPPPITGRQLTIRIDEVYDHHARHTCLAELTLFEGPAPVRFVPSAPGTTLPGAFAPSLEGAWAPRGVVEPEKFLVFYRDGHFAWLVEPNLGQRVIENIGGDWSVTTEQGLTHLSLDPPGPDPGLTGTVRFNVEPDGRPTLVLEDAYPGVYTPWVPSGL